MHALGNLLVLGNSRNLQVSDVCFFDFNNVSYPPSTSRRTDQNEDA